MTTSEVVTITPLFHLSGARTFKHFYIGHVQKQLHREFPDTVPYNRSVELMQRNLLPLALSMKTCCPGKCTGISFIDSTSIPACDKKRIKQNKAFKEMAHIGKSTMGRFYGFKLPIVINDKGEVLDFIIIPAHVDDRAPLKEDNFLKKIFGSLYATKGYISKQLTALLCDQGLHLVTGIRNNMKNVLMAMRDKILLRKRFLIETINDQLKT